MINVRAKDPIKIRIMIGKQGKSLKRFSSSIGISDPYLSQILNNKRNPSPVVADKIARGLGKEVEDIFLIENVAKDNHDQEKQEV